MPSLSDAAKKKAQQITPKRSGISEKDQPLEAPKKEQAETKQQPAQKTPAEKQTFSPVDGEPNARLQVDIPESLLMAFEEWVTDEKRTARAKRKRTSKNELAATIIEKSMIARGYYKRRSES